MNVRSSTRATSLASDRAKKQPGQSSWFSRISVPRETISLHNWSYSSCEPSTQWMRSGLHSAAIFLTQRRRWTFSLIGLPFMDKTGEGGKRLDELMVAIVFGVSNSPASGESDSIESAAIAMRGINLSTYLLLPLSPLLSPGHGSVSDSVTTTVLERSERLVGVGLQDRARWHAAASAGRPKKRDEGRTTPYLGTPIKLTPQPQP